ncbi:MAG: protein kinase [Planctomycetota bacterium]|nr:protein kinase [Planctomycetota bacterium]
MPRGRIGDFELLAKLGEGGMGAVYKARQRSMGRTVALKLLSPQLAGDASFVARFAREARATARLNHPHIVAGLVVGEADGFHYFAMEFVEGRTLRQRVEREGELPEAELLRIGEAVARALAHAHAHGIIHRDVKPENILIDAQGVPKLADLGLARVARASDGALTQTGMVVGSPHYMAPEQVRGDAELDGRADAYALGATLYFAATGRTCYDGESPAVVMVKHLNEAMPHPRSIRPGLSQGVCRLLERLLLKDRDARLGDLARAAEYMAALRAGRADETPAPPAAESPFLPLGARGASERHSSKRLPPVRARERRPRLPAARQGGGAAALLLAGAAAAVLLLLLLRGDPPVQPARATRPEPPAKSDSPALTPREMPPAPVSAPEPAPQPPDPGGAFAALFNGKDLAGWRIVDGRWTVRDGALLGSETGKNAFISGNRLLPRGFELELQVEGSGDYHFGWSAPKNVWTDYVHCRGGERFQLTRYGNRRSEFMDSTTRQPDGSLHRWRLLVQGSAIRAFLNGEPILSSEQGQDLAEGELRDFFLFVGPGQEAAWSGIRMRELRR